MIQWFECSSCDHCCCINLFISNPPPFGAGPNPWEMYSFIQRKTFVLHYFKLFKIVGWYPFNNLYSDQKPRSPDEYLIYPPVPLLNHPTVLCSTLSISLETSPSFPLFPWPWFSFSLLIPLNCCKNPSTHLKANPRISLPQIIFLKWPIWLFSSLAVVSSGFY